MLVSVGSRNPAKTQGVALAFNRFFSANAFSSVDVSSEVKIQPMTLEETLEGARMRAEIALRHVDGDFGVGVEAGLLACGAEHLNLQVAVITDRRGRSTSGSSCGFMLPAPFVRRMQKGGVELDRFARELTGVTKVEEEHGIIYHLSKKSVSRVDMTDQCVTMALVPWLNKELYGIQ